MERPSTLLLRPVMQLSLTFRLKIFDFLPGFLQQDVTLEAQSSLFGKFLADSALGCANPPCMTMDTSVANFDTTNLWLTKNCRL